MADEDDLVEVVHTGPAEGAIGNRESCGFYDVRLHAQTGAKAKNCAGILGDVRLVKRDPHGRPGESLVAISLSRRMIYATYPRR